MKSFCRVLIALVFTGTVGSASATLLSFGVNLIGSVTVNTGDITALTTLKTIPVADQVSSCTGDVGACALAGIAPGGAATFSTGTLNTFLGPDAFSITAGGLTFSFTDNVLATIIPTGEHSAGAISLQFNGTVTAGPGAFLGQTASLSETCTQVSTGAVITCSESVATPGVHQLPEPISLFLLGIGLLALWINVRRRSS